MIKTKQKNSNKKKKNAPGQTLSQEGEDGDDQLWIYLLNLDQKYKHLLAVLDNNLN